MEQMAFTYREVSEILRLSERKVKNMVYEGRLRAVKFGKSVRIPRQSIDEALQPPKSEKVNVP